MILATGMKQTAKDWDYLIAGGSPGLLCVNKDSGISSFEDMINKAKEAPDSIVIASTEGGLWFIQANLFKQYADIPFGNKTFAGSRDGIMACVSGDVDAVVASSGEVADFVKSGDLIPVTTIQTDDYDFADFGTIEAVTKQVPEVAKYLPLSQFLGIAIPKDTPEDVKTEIKDTFSKIMTSDSIKNFADEQYAVIYNKTGDDAYEFTQKAESILCWILQDMGLTQYSPEDFDIPKP